MRRWMPIASLLLPALVLSRAQEHSPAKSIPDLSLSIVGDPAGLNDYVAVLRKRIFVAWLDHWPLEKPEPGRYILTLHINHSGYLDHYDGSPFVPAGELQVKAADMLTKPPDPARAPRVKQAQTAALRAALSVFEGLPPDPPDDYAHNQIVIKAAFVYGSH
ncbi:MAG: hypothetical protein JO022_09785 [Acidobacteriaceae bacterium]|nr:hypothetical protein [Acidobacteriaceae bacterium]